MIDKTKLIDKLDKATDKAASMAIKSGVPIPYKKSYVWVGNTSVRKNSSGFYDVLTLDKKPIYENIYVFDVATIIAQRYSLGEFKTIEKVMALENTYSKYHNDMLHYLHCMKAAKKRKDYDTMAILEDKFQISEIRAKKTKDSISFFKRVK